MQKCVKCVYRIHEKAEMIVGKFDTTTGVIVEIPDAVKLDAKRDYEYIRENYVLYPETPTEKLFISMCRFAGSLAVIEYNRIGVIVVWRDSYAVFAFKKDIFIRQSAFKEEQFKIPVEDIGVVKTPVRTFDVAQRIAHLIVDISGDTPVVHTRYGKCAVGFRYDKPETPNLSMFLEMCDNDKAYGSIEYKGKVKLVGIEEKELRVIGGC